MEKTLKINFKKYSTPTKFAFFGGKIIKVRTLISRQNAIGIIQNCLDNYFNKNSNMNANVGNFEHLNEIKVLYDILVLSVCTNVNVLGVEPTDIYESKIIQKIAPKIKNYADIWEFVLQAIEYKNQYNALNLIAESLPSDKNMGKVVQTINGLIADLKKNEPKLLNTMIDAAKINAEKQVSKDATAKATKELKEKAAAEDKK